MNKNKSLDPAWLAWCRRLQAIAQTGLTYAKDPYDIERYHLLHALAAEMTAASTQQPIPTILGQFQQEHGYATPKVVVRGAVFQQQKILLVRERRDGGWTLPGGFAEVWHSPSENVVKEIREESGYLTKAVKLLAVYDRSRHAHPPTLQAEYTLYFLCEIIGGSAQTSLETDGVAFFAEDALPNLSLGRTLPSQIARLFAHYRHPEWPPDYD